MSRATWLTAIVSFGLVMVAAWLLSLAWSSAQAPIVYDQDIYQPEQSDLCPGESLVYTNTLTVYRRANIEATLSWWSVDQQRFIGPPTTYPARPFARVPTSITARRSNEIPPLPAGRYEMWFGAGETGKSAATHAVPFRIRAGC